MVPEQLGQLFYITKVPTVWKLIHEDAQAPALGLLRVWVFGIWLFKLAVGPVHLLSYLPQQAFQAPGVITTWQFGQRLAACAVDPLWLWTLRLVTVLVLGVVVAGVGSRRTIDAACVLLLVHELLLRGFGHTNHGELVLLFAAFVLAAFPCQDAFVWRTRQSSAPAADRDSAQYALPLIIITGMLCGSYMLVGLHRLAWGGWSIFNGRAIQYFLLENLYANSDYSWQTGHTVLSNDLLRTLFVWGFPLITALEIAAPLALIFRPIRWLLLGGMLAFHLSSLLLFHIFFWENCLLFVLLLDLSAIAQRVRLVARQAQCRFARLATPGQFQPEAQQQ